jgi:ribosomal protein L27
LKDAKFAVASQKRGADSGKDNKDRKKRRVKIDDSDEESDSKGNVLVEGRSIWPRAIQKTYT